ncbi:MAG: putative replicase protein [Alehxovirus fundihabitans]|uniref:RNA-directed RNA polymerase n=1 Tax=Leviviridae sp. TaxID=2027243 RepID=A0ABY3SSC6_9VIRU|nr:MAG: putative replicase protein [Leviviridae sp.]
MKDLKSYEDYLLGYYGAMLSDIARHHPSLQKECDRDNKRLLSAVKQHGLHFLCEVLPSFGKHFDQCLSKGRLTPSGLCHFRPFRKGGSIPRLFKGLILRVFDHSGELRSVPDVQAIRDVRQLCFAAKRLRIPCPDSKTWEQVYEFFKTDSEIVQPSLNWDVGDFSSDSCGLLQLGDDLLSKPGGPLFTGGEPTASSTIDRECIDFVQRTADCIAAQIGRFDPFDWKPRHGPGAVADLKDKSYKYDFPNWPPKLEKEFPNAEFGFSNVLHFLDLSSHLDRGSRLPLEHEPPARLIAVPKSYSGPRLIAAEPVAHQFCQQAISSFLMSRVRETISGQFISFNDQTKNASLALEASLDGSLSTIDLSSASDRMSCWLVERIFRRSPSLLDAFYAVRTRWIRQDLDRTLPTYSRLNKFSTMGSAVTFPVQSIVFLCIAIGTTLYERRSLPTYASIRSLRGQVRVFGDDIIVPTYASGMTVAALEHFGFKVNRAKTFCSGRFRESCGMEAFGGEDITKVSLLSPPSVSKPESILSSIDTHNNLVNRGWYCTADYIKTSVDKMKRYCFPLVGLDSGAIGWSTFSDIGTHFFKRRWNPDLQRREILVTQPRGCASRTPVDSNSVILQYFTEVTSPPVSHEERLGRVSLRHPIRLGRVWVPEL